MTRIIRIVLALSGIATLAGGAQHVASAQAPRPGSGQAQEASGRVRPGRWQHEPQILHELFDLVAIPNVASDKDGIARNAQALMRMFEKRRFLPETIATAESPV